jgi:hypothetical protein
MDQPDAPESPQTGRCPGIAADRAMPRNRRGPGLRGHQAYAEGGPSWPAGPRWRRARAYAGPGAAAPYSGGSPNEANRPAFWKAMIRAIPVVVTVGTSTACAT